MSELTNKRRRSRRLSILPKPSKRDLASTCVEEEEMTSREKRRKKTSKETGCLRHGYYSDRGRRDYQEDRYAVHIPFVISGGGRGRRKRNAKTYALLGVYDGHGGQNCSDFVSKRLPKELSSDLKRGMNPVAALVNCHLATEVAYLRQEDPNQVRSGTTAVTVLVDTERKRLWVAHVGDSRALLIRKTGPAVRLTEDHDAKNEDELKRMTAVGGFVDEFGYVNGMVQVARAIGDYDAKILEAEDSEDETTFVSAVMPIPDVSTRDIEAGKDMCLVIGCDGLFEAKDGSVAWINRLVKARMKSGDSPGEIAEKLVRKAIDDGSEDNTTAVVAFLE